MDDNTPDKTPENHEALNEAIKHQLDKIRKKFTELEDPTQKLKDGLTAYDDKKNKEFKKTLKNVKHILKSKNLILPDD